MGIEIPNILLPGALVWFEKTQGLLVNTLPVPGWRPLKQLAVRAFLTMWQSSRRLVCRGRPEPGLRVNDISRIRWSQHLLTTQSERPNLRATHLADPPDSMMPMMILPLSNCGSCSYCLRKWRNGMSTSALSL
ncbi:uncharacterized protein TNCV_3186371 [Trichonephila clavipes]|nr:uncharacterized protein TNCV_3186371 [Trichonephila clavipes]